MIGEISWFVSSISMGSIALPIIIGLFCRHRLQSVQKVILILVLLSASIEFIAKALKTYGGYQNLVYYFFTMSEFLLLTYVFKRGISPFFKTVFFQIIAVLFVLFVVIDILWISGMEQFNSYSTTVEGLILISFSLIFYYKTLAELKIEHLERSPYFWISTGVLLYFSSSLFIFLFTNYVNSSKQSLFIIWGIHAIFSILLNISYSLALWVKPKP